MPTVKQYPHIMSWTGKGSNSSVDSSTGFPKPGSSGQAISAACRYENFGITNRREWTAEDGKTIWQRGTVFVKLGESVPKKFEHIQVKDGDKVIFEGPVLNVYEGQLNSTIAV